MEKKDLTLKDKKKLVFLCRFLQKYNITKSFFEQRLDDKTNLLLSYNLFDAELGWRGTREGWNFWANISVRWKNAVALRKNIFDIHGILNKWECEQSSYSKLSDNFLKKHGSYDNKQKIV